VTQSTAAGRPSLSRALLDARMAVGGVGRYRDELVGGLREVAPHLRVSVLERRRSRRWGRDAPFTPWGRTAVAREALRTGADVVHGLHLELPAMPGPSVVTVHDVIPLVYPGAMPNPVARAYFRGMLARSLARADKVIAPSHSTAGDLVRHGAPHRKIEIIPIGVGGRFRPLDESDRERARSRYARGRPYVASVAEARAHKNRRVLAEVAHLLPDTTFVCRGSRLRGAPGNLWFLERLSMEDLALFYAGAELLLMTSLIEGYGLPALEAAACATPVLAGRRVGVAAYLEAGVVVVDPADPRGVATRVAGVWSDASMRRDLAEAARSAASRLTTSGMARATAELYGRLPAAA
jgi:glycosyltransferase involved in cell wall biosynthesis